MRNRVVSGVLLALLWTSGRGAVAEDCVSIGNTPVCIGMKKEAVINALVEAYELRAKMKEDGKASEDIWFLRAKSGEVGEGMKGIIEFHKGRVRSVYKNWGTFQTAGQLFEVIFHVLSAMAEKGDVQPDISLHEISLSPGASWKQIKIRLDRREIDIKQISDREASTVLLDENLRIR